MNRRAFVTGLGAVLAAPVATEAQQAPSARTAKIGQLAVGFVPVPGVPTPEGLPKDISKVVFPNDFDWSAKNRDRILAEWTKRYAK